MSDTLATAEELAALDALTAKAGVAREFFRYGRTGPLTSQEVLARTIHIMAGLVPPVATEPAAAPSPRADLPHAPPMSDAQMRFMRRLAHEVTGDGEAHVAAFKAAHGHEVTTAQASAELNRLKALKASGQRADVPASKTPRAPATTTAPVGRYAVDLPGVSAPVLVEITKPADGRWAGYTFVKTVPFLPGGKAEPIKGRDAILVLNAVEASPLGCAAAYGRITGRCGQCNRKLANNTLGIGPECLTRFAS